MLAHQQLRSACPQLWGAGDPSTPLLQLATPRPLSCTSSHHINSPTLRSCITTCSKMDRAAQDSAVRTPPSSRSLRSTSRRTTATTGGPTNISCLGSTHPHTSLTEAKKGAHHSSCKYKLPPPPAEIPSSPVSWSSTPAALTVVREVLC